MINIINLSKRYSNAKIESLKNINLDIKDGEVFGLIGKNGAGKSTLIKCITGIISSSNGKILINDLEASPNNLKVKMQIGFCPDDHSVYETLTGREFCNFVADVYKVSKRKRGVALNKLVPLFEMEKAFDNQIKSYSHGMKQKICIIGSLIHNPKIWILDEPMVGLDPQTIQVVMNLIKEFKLANKTVIFSSHTLSTIEKVCDRAGIINKGELVGVVNIKGVDTLNLQGEFNKRIALHDILNKGKNVNAKK